MMILIISHLYNKVEKLEAEVNRWRSGETVRPEEQVNLVEIEAVTPVTSFIEEKPPVAVSCFIILYLIIIYFLYIYKKNSKK